MFGSLFKTRQDIPSNAVAWRPRRLGRRALGCLLSGLAVGMLPGDGIWIPVAGLVPLAFFALMVGEAVTLYYEQCPRCGKPFCRRGGFAGIRNIFVSRCMHCSWPDPDEADPGADARSAR